MGIPLHPTTLPNLRDVGGSFTADDGRVRRGLLYRSTALDRLGAEDARLIDLHGIRTVFDLRTEGERLDRPDLIPPRLDLVALDMLRDAPGPGPAEMMRLFADPVAATEALGAGQGVAMFERKYREFIALPSAREALGRLLRALSESSHRPALIHCTTGKDRTGWAVAVLQLSLAVPLEEVTAEFLRSNDALLPAFEADAERFAAAGGDPEVVRGLIRVYPEYLQAALDEASAIYGSIESYVADGLGVDGGVIRGLREAFVERAAA